MLTIAKLAVRRLLNSPQFTITAVLTLSFCVLANLFVFSAIYSTLLRPLPYPAAERLVILHNAYPGHQIERAPNSIPNYYDRRSQITAFESVAIYRQSNASVGIETSVRNAEVGLISPNFFNTLGVPLRYGREFTDSEMDRGSSQVTIITDEFWKQNFNSDPTSVGKSFICDGLSVVVVGILPPGFKYLGNSAEFFRPAVHTAQERQPDFRHVNQWEMIARLAQGATISVAQSQVDSLNREQLRDDPYATLLATAKFHTRVSDLQNDYTREARPILTIVQCGVLLLFVIATVNIANLLLLRASSRSREFAIRRACGGKAVHVISELSIEALMLSCASVAAALLAQASLRSILARAAPPGMQFENSLPLNVALAFCIGTPLVCSLVLAAPACWFTLRNNLAVSIQSESRSGTTSKNVQKTRFALMMTQVTLAFTLLSVSGLLVESVQKLARVNPGFSVDGVYTTALALPKHRYNTPELQQRFTTRLTSMLQGAPGISGCAAGSAMPFHEQPVDNAIATEGSPPQSPISAHFLASATQEYWRLMGIALLDGRALDQRDEKEPGKTCVIDKALADRYWKGSSAIGRRLSLGSHAFNERAAITVVGVVATVKHADLAETDGHGIIYLTPSYLRPNPITLVVKSALPDQMVGLIVQKALRSIDPALAAHDLRSLQDRIQNRQLARRSAATLTAIFACCALLLAGVGIYAVLSYSVAQRKREIGIRVALGAKPQSVLALFLSTGLKVVLAGVAVAVPVSVASGYAIRSVLYGVSPAHASHYLLSLVILLPVASLACAIPAWRAARQDPLICLRSE
jgi:predicted permease